jgi:hypothetical protein
MKEALMSRKSVQRSRVSVTMSALAGLMIAALVSAEGLAPGGFSLSWSTVDGGGGTSSGGAFTLNGSIGQPDAGATMSGGPFALTGGFWPSGAATCTADIAPAGTPNGTVNVDDLLAVINAWGVCANPNVCPADIAPIGGNDVVNVDDLLAVINAWGACPN